MLLKELFGKFKKDAKSPSAGRGGAIETGEERLSDLEQTISKTSPSVEDSDYSKGTTAIKGKDDSQDGIYKSLGLYEFLSMCGTLFSTGVGLYLIRETREPHHLLQSILDNMNEIGNKFMYDKKDLETYKLIQTKLQIIAGYPGDSTPILKLSKREEDLLKRMIRDTEFITLQGYDEIPQGTVISHNEDGNNGLREYTSSEWDEAIKETNILKNTVAEQKGAIVSIAEKQVAHEKNLDSLGAGISFVAAALFLYSCIKVGISNKRRKPKVTNTTLIENVVDDVHIEKTPKSDSSKILSNYSDAMTDSIDKLIDGVGEKSLNYRFGTLSQMVNIADSIDLTNYKKIENFLEDKQKYLLRELKRKGNKVDQSTEILSLEVSDDYLSQTLTQYGNLKKALENKKNDQNQLSKYPELEAILTGGNLEEYFKSDYEKSEAVEPKVNYSKGNYLWANRCENIKKFFSIEKNQKKELLEYAHYVLSKQAKKLKTEDGTAKISAYEKNIDAFNDALSDIAKIYSRSC